MKKHRDRESIGDGIGLNINVHTNFGPNLSPQPLTPIIAHQDSPDDSIDNIKK